MTCPHSLIEPALDRWSECHWHLHQMELSYHEPDPFRYSLNSFIRAFKEVPQVLNMTIQRNPELRGAISGSMAALRARDLYQHMAKTRDFLVHQGMLEVESRGSAGTTEGSKVKMAFPFAVFPYESSDDAYLRYKEVCRNDKVMRGLIGPDCDSAPAIWRTWMIKQFPGQDLLDVAFTAWSSLGAVLSEAVVAQGGDPLDLSLPCRHDPEAVRIKRFSQSEFFLAVDGIDLEEEARKWRNEKQLRALSSAEDKKS